MSVQLIIKSTKKGVDKMKLLTAAASNAKTAKNLQFDQYLTYILHLAPARLSGYNVCPQASAGCIAACLNTAGRGAFSNVQQARIRKTHWLMKQRADFLQALCKDLDAVVRKATKLGKTAVVRLNGTSDLQWENIKLPNGKSIFETYASIQFYDYTKILRRLEKLSVAPIANYHLTFSKSETNDNECVRALQLGYNVAVVFADVPPMYMGAQVVDGDGHDLRFLDAPGSVVALKAKGKARKDESGFVVQSNCNRKAG
jgi:Gene product 88